MTGAGMTGNVDDLSALLENIARKHDIRARVSAANRTRDQVTTQTRRGLTSEYRIPAGAVANKRVFKGKKATVRDPAASFKVGTWVVPVAKMGKVSELKRGGVSFNTVGGRTINKSAFVVPSLGASPFVREPGAKRLPIKKITADISAAASAVLEKTASDENVGAIFGQRYRSTLDYLVEKEASTWKKAGR